MIRVYLDTNVFITAFESIGPRSDEAGQVLNAISGHLIEGVTSELTLAELLPMPLSRSQDDLVALYGDLVKPGSLIETVAVGRSVLLKTASLRSTHRALKLPDAVHLATAIIENCAVFVSSDLRIPDSGPMTVVRLAPGCLGEIMKVLT